jgi:hypothetical protein
MALDLKDALKGVIEAKTWNEMKDGMAQVAMQIIASMRLRCVVFVSPATLHSKVAWQPTQKFLGCFNMRIRLAILHCH